MHNHIKYIPKKKLNLVNIFENDNFHQHKAKIADVNILLESHLHNQKKIY